MQVAFEQLRKRQNLDVLQLDAALGFGAGHSPCKGAQGGSRFGTQFASISAAADWVSNVSSSMPPAAARKHASLRARALGPGLYKMRINCVRAVSHAHRHDVRAALHESPVERWALLRHTWTLLESRQRLAFTCGASNRRLGARCQAGPSGFPRARHGPTARRTAHGPLYTWPWARVKECNTKS